ncbi:MAG: hypothetical protein JEZ06_18695 [Anaerolineaceae bacterium]|nr:hypothetical protein [Anaerolineaceae bacterium]
MFKKNGIIITVLMVMVILFSACSTSSGNEEADTTEPVSTNGNNQAEIPLSSSLMIGTFKLEETDQAVTVEQAAELLPLWKAVNSFAGSGTASAEELQALYKQIESIMEDEQLNVIAAMGLTQEDMMTLMGELGIDFGSGGNGQRPDLENMTEEEREQMIAQRQNQIPGGGQGNPEGVKMNPEASDEERAERMASRGAQMTLSPMLLDELISLLESK